MKSSIIFNGQEVWITGGLDKGKKGIVIGGGWGVYSIQLDSETKTYDRHSVSTTNPKSHNVPLPPSFIPSEFKIGDLVEVNDHPAGHHYNGLKGKIIRLPTSTSYRNGGDPRYGMEITGKGSTTYSIGNRIFFEAPHLRKPVKKVRYVGDEIGHEDVQIGDTVRTELRSTDGTYSHTSTKQGKVFRITENTAAGSTPWQIYSFENERNHGLTFGQAHEKITLLEISVDPYVAIVENLAAGTVVVHERESGEVLTYVKSLPFAKQSQWHSVSSQNNASSTFVDDRDIIDALNNGAEIVHKVRKPKPVAVPF